MTNLELDNNFGGQGRRDADTTIPTTTTTHTSSSEPCVCDCQCSVSPVFAEIKQASNGLQLDTTQQAEPPSDEEQVETLSSRAARMIPLDDALILGRRLTLEWERINGCLNVDQHLRLGTVPGRHDTTATSTSTTLVASMAHAVDQLLRTYEVALGSIAPAPDPGAVVRSCLGPLELVGAEAAIVAQEALRHMIARLGDVLKDIEEEVAFTATGTNAGFGGSQTDMEVDAAITAVSVMVKRAQGLMFRLLGRIPR
ncbi:hypothetical protein QBC37DRAFT_372639 [Rhypophila decipiens]|uniref:Uncharacterized protein n=1 Tax=Rhypophila decipiens TaxID=261697 RepID=A0AAN6YBC0_9PEZI|nr:hypothetical protein QBC37DRAFT_372639 [Rhypophila decipiens]